MRIRITALVEDDELIDADHPMGLTTEGFDLVTDALTEVGLSDFDITQVRA